MVEDILSEQQTIYQINSMLFDCFGDVDFYDDNFDDDDYDRDEDLGGFIRDQSRYKSYRWEPDPDDDDYY